MIIRDKKTLWFKQKDIWFAEAPYDVKGFAQVSFHCCRSFASLPGFQVFETRTLGIDLNQDLELIWGSFSKTTRYEITKAQDSGSIVKINQDYHPFMELNRRFRQAKGLEDFEVPMEEMKQNGVLFLVFNDDILQGGQFYLADDQYMRLLLSVSRRLEADKDQHKYISYGNRFLIWEAIRYAKERGIAFFDLGGYSTNEDDQQVKGINQFKLGFSNNIWKRYRYIKTYSETFKTLKNLAAWIRPK